MTQTLTIEEIGEIKGIKKSIAKVTGLSNCMNGQLLDITASTKGVVVGFVEGEILVLLLGKTEEVKVGDRVVSKMESFQIPVGTGFVGRVVNALAQPMDGKGAVVVDAEYPVFRDAPSVLERIPLNEAFETGMLMIDTSVPIGKGQRELIVGDRMTGKTTICVDAILNQKGKEVICIYCSIGRSASSLRRVLETFKAKGALAYTVVVSATASSSGGEQYIAPYAAAALGEYFMDHGRNVFVVFDDLTKHAWVYRQISLLLGRSPGRDAYPGDIFYLHSQLMERAGRLSPERGGGSMTFFPIVDTLQGDVTGYVPSNLISMTDGQIYLNASLFSAGVKPAIDLGLSVSRIGNKVHCPAMKELSGMLRLEYIQYNELLRLTRFKTAVSGDVNQQLQHGEAVTRLFMQGKNEPRSLEEQLMLLYALRTGVLDGLSKEAVDRFVREILAFARQGFPQAVTELSAQKALTPAVKQGLDECLKAFFQRGS